MTIQITLRISLLLHQKEGQKIKTSTRLSEDQCHDHMQPIPTTSHFRSHTQP